MSNLEAGFPRSTRLLKPEEYRRVFQQPIKTADDCFTVLRRESDLGRARLGLAVAKKNARRAVDRNRIKRVVRESFRQNHSYLGSRDYVILIRKDTSLRSNQELSISLSWHWQKILKRSGRRHEV